MATGILTVEYSFFDEVARICEPAYTPIEADVLRARTKTTGIYETRFTMGQLSIQYACSSSMIPLSRPQHRFPTVAHL
jgi:hypothetical protein